MIQPRKVIRIMRKVCIHFKNELVFPGKRPLKSVDIGRSQALLSSSLVYEQLSWKSWLEVLHHLRSAIGRTVINNDYVKVFLQIENCMQNGGNILSLIIRWYDNKLLHSCAN